MTLGRSANRFNINQKPLILSIRAREQLLCVGEPGNLYLILGGCD
jgi:hypothetical protein